MQQVYERASNEVAFWQVRSLISAGRCEDALFQLSIVVREFPNWAEPWALVSQALSMMCRYDDALLATEQALEIDPAHIWAHELQTALYLKLNLRDEALVSAQRLVAISPNRAESHAYMAFAESFAGRDRQALASARRCKKISPNSIFGHQAMCVVHLASRRWEKAERSAKAALLIDDLNASLFHDLAIAQLEQGKYDDAYLSMSRAVQLDQRFASALERLQKKQKPAQRRVPVMALVAVLTGLVAVPLAMTQIPAVFIALAIVGSFTVVAAMRRLYNLG